MRIEARDIHRRRLGRIAVDPAARPTRVPLPGESSDVFLNWDSALDDAGNVRRCVVCGCTDLFQEKVFPQVTGLVVALAFIGAIAGAFTGIFTREINMPLMIAMLIVLALDLGILVFARRRLVCYRCRSSFHSVPIARYHRRWDRAIAERYPAPEPSAGDSMNDAEPPWNTRLSLLSRFTRPAKVNHSSAAKEGTPGG